MFTFAVSVALGQSKIDYVNIVFGLLSASNEKVIWFDISMYYAFLMGFLNTSDHLDRDHQTRLEVELALAGLK